MDKSPEQRIEELRGEIDRIDAELIALFEKRMDTARAIGCIKQQSHIAVKNQNREMQVKANCRENCKNKHYCAYAEAMMECIIGSCRGIQNEDASEKL